MRSAAGAERVRVRAAGWRPRRPRTRRGTALLLGSLLALAIVAPVAAAEFLQGNSPSVDQGETVTEDLYVMGGEVEIAGTVTRDLNVLAGDLTITDTGRVEGNINAAAGNADLSGIVRRSVRVAAGDVEISSAVGGDVVVAGGNVTIDEGASIQGDVVLAGGDVVIRGEVAGDVRGSAGSIVIDAPVGGDVKLKSDDIELGDGAQIAGRFEYTSDNEAEIDDQAVITGEIDRNEPDRFSPGDNLIGWLSSPLLHIVWLLVAGDVLILLIPRACVAVANGVRHRPLPSFGLGLLLLIVTPIVILILFFTVIGWPIAFIGLFAFLVALYLSEAFVGLAIGRFILPNRWGDEGRGFNLLAMTLGVLILAGIRLIPVPYLSDAIALVVAIIGLGAVVVGARGRANPAPPPSYGYAPY